MSYLSAKLNLSSASLDEYSVFLRAVFISTVHYDGVMMSFRNKSAGHMKVVMKIGFKDVI